MGLFNDSYNVADAAMHMKKANDAKKAKEQEKQRAQKQAAQSANKTEAEKANEENPFV